MKSKLDLDAYYFNGGSSVSTDGSSVSCSHTFKPDDVFFRGHFPGNPVVPGVVLIKGMLAAIGQLRIADDSVRDGAFALEKILFKKVLHPGDSVSIKASLVGRGTDGVSLFRATVLLGKERAAMGEISIGRMQASESPA